MMACGLSVETRYLRRGFLWLLTGGVSSAGVIFFPLNHGIHWAHGIWLLFVLAGSVCHYFAILLYV